MPGICGGVVFFISFTWHLNGSNWRRVFKYHFSLLICRCRNGRSLSSSASSFAICHVQYYSLFPSLLHTTHGRCVCVWLRNVSLLLCKHKPIHAHGFLCALDGIQYFRGDCSPNCYNTRTWCGSSNFPLCKPLYKSRVYGFFRRLCWIKYITECHFVSYSVYHTLTTQIMV